MKPRRDITLGEMQDECKKYWNNGDFGYCGKCQYMSVCCHYERYCPAQLNLTDPPRFNESQMALLKALRGLDFVSIENLGSGAFQTKSKDGKTGLFMKLLGIEDGETLDLAELLGKDGADANK